MTKLKRPKKNEWGREIEQTFYVKTVKTVNGEVKESYHPKRIFITTPLWHDIQMRDRGRNSVVIDVWNWTDPIDKICKWCGAEYEYRHFKWVMRTDCMVKSCLESRAISRTKYEKIYGKSVSEN